MRRDERGDQPTITPRMMIAMGAVVLGLVFIAENTKKTDIRFIVPKVQSPLWLALLVTFVVGAAAGWFFARSYRRD
jgi:uncharacterized integral membrane protein